MRLVIYSLIASCLLLPRQTEGQDAAYSIAPSKQEEIRIKEGVRAMHDAMITGNVDVIMAKTFPLLIRFSGGEEAFKESIEQAIRQLKTDGLKFESYELGKPSLMYLAGSEWICFVPEISVAQIKGRRFRSTGFVIGVRGGTSTKWRFLEAVHLKKDPDALWRLFPELSKNVKLPPIKQELLEDKPGSPR